MSVKITNVSNHLSNKKLESIAHDKIYSNVQRRQAKKILLTRGKTVKL